MSTASRTKDPFGPLDFIVSFLLTLMTVAACVTVVVSLIPGSSISPVLGVWGQKYPCVLIPQSGLAISSSDAASRVLDLKPGATLGVPDSFRVCSTAMTAGDKALWSIPIALNLAWFVGFLLLARRLSRRGRSSGLFTESFARATSHLGWYILAGGALVTVVGALLHAIATSHLVNDYSIWSGWPNQIDWNWTAIIAGLATLSIGRVMRLTVPLREEVDATV